MEESYNYRPHSIRWRGSILPKVLPATLLITVVATIVTVLYKETSVKLSIDSTFIPILGFVVGLLLTYRTNTAYDRYWEGRRLWAVLVVAIRNLTRNIWINVKGDGTKDLLEKKTAINLLLGFAIATKHYLREEKGIHEDLKPYISNIRSDLPGFEPTKRPPLKKRILKKKVKPHQRKRKHTSPKDDVLSNLPLEITLYLSSYIDSRNQEGKIDVPIANTMYSALNSMVDCLTHVERILMSPIPAAYAIHLNQTVMIYCISLPFQLVKVLGYITIPAVFLASGILIGIEEIAGEIENPFGYDDNDLDLDEFCQMIKFELDRITSSPPPTVESWVYNPENRPFGDDITGPEARKLSLDVVRSKLSNPPKDNSKDNSPSNTEANNSSLDISVQK